MAKNPVHLYIGRFFTGITGGGIYLCVPLFVSDIADPKYNYTIVLFLRDVAYKYIFLLIGFEANWAHY